MSAVATMEPVETVWRTPGESFNAHLSGGREAMVAAEAQLPRASCFSDGEVSASVETLDALAEHAMLLMARTVAEALRRGVHSQVGLSAHDWTTRRCPGLSPVQVSDVVTVAQTLSDPTHQDLAVEITDGRLPLRRAASVIRSLRRVRPVLEADEYAQAMITLTSVAAQQRFTDRDLKTAADRLLSAVLPERDHEAQASAARELRSVNESSLADGSFVRFIVTCEPQGAAVFRALLTSHLAAPHPDSEGPDSRTAVQRRYDALLGVLERGIAGSDSTPAAPTAKVMVTMAYDVLQQTLAGLGATASGDVLSPETVRQLACDAEIIPAVLGTHREVLALGRSKRLVTPGQRRVLEHRDAGCTYPGCTVPAAWTDAHHVLHWSRGGRSDVSNYALLCGRHHTLVHQHDLTATISSTGVRWHV